MADMQFKSFEELKKHSDLTKELLIKLKNSPSETVYNSFTSLAEKGLDQRNNLEKRLVFLFRAGAVASILCKKADFEKFKDKKGQVFYLKYTDCVNEIDKLSPRVGLLYDDKANKREPQIIPKKEPIPKVVPVKKSSLFIGPKEVVGAVINEKKCVVVFDYRLDKSRTIAGLNFPNFIVISVDNGVIVKGLIFNKLSTQLPVGQRPLLPKVFEADLIVFMEERDPTIENGNLVTGTKADILRRAVTQYHPHQKKLGEDKGPFILKGGFDNFKLTYPTYISSDQQSINKADLDEVQLCINDYKNSVSHLVYPDVSLTREISHKDVPPKQEPSKRKETTFDINPNAPSSAFVVSHPKPGKCVRYSFVITFVLLLFHHVRKQDLVIDEVKPPVPKHSPPPNEPPANKPSVLPPGPSIDRSSKPNIPEPRPPKTDARPPPRNNNVVATIDRSTKPQKMSTEDESRCLEIYDKMYKFTAEDSSRRSGPSRGNQGFTGLFNTGNTCFMNASLQALIHTPELVRLFTRKNFMTEINPKNQFGTRGIISSVFSALLDLMWSGEYSAIRPKKFLNTFASEVNSTLADGHQHDASEFQIFLLDALHEDTNSVYHRVSFEQNYKGGARIAEEADDYNKKSLRFSNSPINRIFNLQTVSELSCQKCHDRSVTFEDCSLITVELPQNSRHTSLEDCLSRHFSESPLDDWNCPKCKSRQMAQRITKLWKLPSVLVVHLKRFSIVNGDYEKNDMYVSFEPEKLDLQVFLHGKASWSQGCQYRLYAITNHRGRLSRGHYTALVAHATTGEWMRMDDDMVSPTTCTRSDLGDAYILFYRKMS
ncbi:unnamed protein product [Auanema sp. JU1783]|nr:unnamed protein product [Auanema sp. JU1783]